MDRRLLEAPFGSNGQPEPKSKLPSQTTYHVVVIGMRIDPFDSSSNRITDRLDVGRGVLPATASLNGSVLDTCILSDTRMAPATSQDGYEMTFSTRSVRDLNLTISSEESTVAEDRSASNPKLIMAPSFISNGSISPTQHAEAFPSSPESSFLATAVSPFGSPCRERTYVAELNSPIARKEFKTRPDTPVACRGVVGILPFESEKNEGMGEDDTQRVLPHEGCGDG
uniref:Uncharacterized protein n=1 Tax=Steinernema glaseri TaxID=37863 RepID=A0A1I8ARE3_9BILA